MLSELVIRILGSSRHLGNGQSSGAANSVCLVLILKELTSLLMKTEAKESNSSGDICEMKCKSC